MTTYILAGGNDTSTPGYIKSLSRVLELLTRDTNSVMLLGCSFSQPREQRRDRFEYFLPYYKQLLPSADNYIDANEEDFFAQLEESEVVYFRGGSSQRLLETLPDFKRVNEALKGKIVIGSSAGANYLAKHAYSPSTDSLIEGSGIIDEAVVNHYGAKEFDGKTFSAADWQDISERTAAAANKSHALCLPEGQFSVIVK